MFSRKFKRNKINKLLENNEINLSYFAEFIFINKRILTNIAKYATIVSLFSLIVTDAKFSSNFSILNRPDSTLNNSSSLSIVSQFTSGASSVFLYSPLIDSNTFLSSIIDEEYIIDNKKTNLIDFFEVEQSWHPMNLYSKYFFDKDRYNQYLRFEIIDIINMASNYSDNELGIFTYEINLKNAQASVAIAEKIMHKLNDFTIQTIQTGAREKRIYLEKRLTELKSDIINSESKLENFLTDNKEFNSSPRLLIQYNNLKLDVDLNYQIKSQVVLEIELLKGNELKDNSQFIIIESPAEALYRSNQLYQIFLKNFLLLYFGAILLFSLGQFFKKN